MSDKDSEEGINLPKMSNDTFSSAVKKLGRPRTSEDLRRIRSLNKFEIEALCHEVLNYTKGEIKARLAHPNITVKEMMICKMAIAVIQESDFKAFEILMSYSVGKPAERFELMGPDQMPIQLGDGVDIDPDMKLDNMDDKAMAEYLIRLKKARRKVDEELTAEQKRNAIDVTQK